MNDVLNKKPKCRMRIMRALTLSWQSLDILSFNSGEFKHTVKRLLRELGKDGKVEKEDIVKSDHGYFRKIVCYRWTAKGYADFVQVQHEKYFQLLKQWHPTFTQDHMMEVKS